MKALLISILLVLAADWSFNHGNVSKRIAGGVAGFVGATGGEARDSIFAR